MRIPIRELEGKTIETITEYDGEVAIKFVDGLEVTLHVYEATSGCETCGLGRQVDVLVQTV